MEASTASPAFLGWSERDIQDLKLVNLAKQGSELHFSKLCRRYHSMIRVVISQYFLPDGEHQDLYQEGLIGLHKAVANYNESTPFHVFARLCIVRNVITAVKIATAKKHAVLSHADCLTEPVPDTDEAMLCDMVAAVSASPVELLILNEEIQVVSQLLTELTQLERIALVGLACGLSYAEVGELGGYSVKAIDNARARAKKKLTRRMRAYDEGANLQTLAGLADSGT